MELSLRSAGQAVTKQLTAGGGLLFPKGSKRLELVKVDESGFSLEDAQHIPNFMASMLHQKGLSQSWTLIPNKGTKERPAFHVNRPGTSSQNYRDVHEYDYSLWSVPGTHAITPASVGSSSTSSITPAPSTNNPFLKFAPTPSGGAPPSPDDDDADTPASTLTSFATSKKRGSATTASSSSTPKRKATEKTTAKTGKKTAAGGTKMKSKSGKK